MSTPEADFSPSLPDGINYTFAEDDMNRLWRVQRAARLLAALDHETAGPADISPDGPAAVAEYIAEDVLDVLLHAQRLGAAPTNPKGPDLI